MVEKNSPEELQEIEFQAIKVQQPIGEFFIASIPSDILCNITYFDVRRMLSERDVETYLGIQRPLSTKRVAELEDYVKTFDACFPTAVILAVEGRCAEYDDASGKLKLRNVPNPEEAEEPVYFRHIARVLDGQHRIAGLENLRDPNFQVNVSIFVDIDIEDQAYIFSTVNLAQTKVNPSLAYDLFELAKSRSPQKTCHNIAVALDSSHEKSPFYKRIKRLGASTAGRTGETISQATFVKSLLPFITTSPVHDRDMLLREERLHKANDSELEKTPFRNLFIEEKDILIADIIWNYFEAVRNRWPIGWAAGGKGDMLNKTNGFRALMRALRPAYLHLAAPGQVPTVDAFVGLFNKVNLRDEDFNVDRFKPGSSGEGLLANTLLSEMNL